MHAKGLAAGKYNLVVINWRDEKVVSKFNILTYTFGNEATVSLPPKVETTNGGGGNGNPLENAIANGIANKNDKDGTVIWSFLDKETQTGYARVDKAHDVAISTLYFSTQDGQPPWHTLKSNTHPWYNYMTEGYRTCKGEYIIYLYCPPEEKSCWYTLPDVGNIWKPATISQV